MGGTEDKGEDPVVTKPREVGPKVLEGAGHVVHGGTALEYPHPHFLLVDTRAASRGSCPRARDFPEPSSCLSLTAEAWARQAFQVGSQWGAARRLPWVQSVRGGTICRGVKSDNKTPSQCSAIPNQGSDERYSPTTAEFRCLLLG